MGTDIHGVFQKHNTETNTWEDVQTEYNFYKHYQLFAVLADERNGVGFAGVSTGEYVTPISLPRGVPVDFNIDEHGYYGEPTFGLQGEDSNRAWLGYHGYSWLLNSEILQWYENAPKVLQVGIVDKEDYKNWDKKSVPQSYYADISGKDIVVVNDSELEMQTHPNWTHVKCSWYSDLKKELAYFVYEVKRLQDMHDKVRFVFGFDS